MVRFLTRRSNLHQWRHYLVKFASSASDGSASVNREETKFVPPRVPVGSGANKTCPSRRCVTAPYLVALGETTWTKSRWSRKICECCPPVLQLGPDSVKHILIECPALISTRNKHFTASSMNDLFDNVAARNIINFIKESHFYSTV